MSVGMVVTLGYGSFGGVNTGTKFIPTLGYTPGPSTSDTHDGWFFEEQQRRRRIIRSEEEEVIALASLATFFLDPGD